MKPLSIIIWRSCLLRRKGLVILLFLVLLPAPFTICLADIPIISGETKTGNITESGQADAYTFFAAAGDSVTILMGDSGANPWSTIELHAPDGTVVITATGTTHAYIQAEKVNQTGTYYIICRDYYGMGTGEYGVSLTAIPVPSSDHLIFDSGDYTGDDTSDIAIFRPSSGLWAVRGLTRAYFGATGDIPVPGDYTGDGTTNIAIFRESSGLWAVSGGPRVYFGAFGDEPLPRDYNGDGTVDIGLFRPTSGLWAIRQVTRMYFGSSADTPVTGYYSGTGASPGIFRSASGLWAIRGVTRVYFGSSSDSPVPGDYAGNGSWHLGIFRSTSGLWAVKGVTRTYFGGSTDSPIPGGYKGDGKDYLGIFRGTSGLWAIKGVTRTYFGSGSDVPVTR